MTAPNPEVAALVWLRSVTSLAADKVATTLPAPATWTGSGGGFLTVVAIGGVPLVDLPIRPTRIQVSAWATNQNSSRPPWRRAAVLADEIVRSCQVFVPVQLTPGAPLAGYDPVTIAQASALTDMRRIASDPAGHARYDMDVLLSWH